MTTTNPSHSFLIECQPIDHEKAMEEQFEDFKQSEKILHLKGFASGINEDFYLSPTILRLVDEHKYIIWDGDSLALSSFTKQLLLIHHYSSVSSSSSSSSASSPQTDQKIFLAFKFANQESEFLGSWHQKLITITTTVKDSFPTHQIAISASTESLAANDCSISKMIIYYQKIPNPSHEPPGEDHFVHLGAKALERTASRKILSIGGGSCIVKEYDRHDINWYILDIYRIKNNEEETCPIVSESFKKKPFHRCEEEDLRDHPIQHRLIKLTVDEHLK